MVKRRSAIALVLTVIWCILCAGSTRAASPISLENPTGFFTNVASRLLISELGLSLNRIQIFPSNQYTPAVHRLLQVTANVYDSATNRSTTDYPFLPTVFRPLFTNDQGIIYISGYEEEPGTNILAVPLRDLSSADDRQALQPTDMCRGIPAIIGARKGFPNFNELAMQTQVSVTRRLEFRRPDLGSPVNETNQMYLMSISNSFGVEAWNSYQTAFSRDLLLLASADLTAVVTNESYNVLFSNTVSMAASPMIIPSNSWPPFTNPSRATASFLFPFQPSNSFLFLPTSTYSQIDHRFVPLTNRFETLSSLPVPLWWLNLNVKAQFALVDLTASPARIVDYVSLDSTATPLNITELLEREDPSVPENQGTGPNPGPNVSAWEMWYTNRLNLATDQYVPTFGILNQIDLGLGKLVPPGCYYLDYLLDPNPPAPGSILCQVNFFRVQFGLPEVPGFPCAETPCQPHVFALTNIFYAPFLPRKDIYFLTHWQVNDPLVHYAPPDITDPAERRIQFGQVQNPPLVNLGRVNDRYHPWGFLFLNPHDTNRYNPAIKDPSVTRSDDWTFPTNGSPALDWLGQVHRGTPWQTLFLKSTNVDLQTWTNWTGDIQSGPHGEPNDAVLTMPSNDWRLASLLIGMLSTNSPASLQSANQPDAAGWQQVLDGITVLSNTAPGQYDSLVMTSYSSQASLIASALQTARTAEPNNLFRDPGDLLSTPELSMASPWLNQSSSPFSGISDEAFEMIPSQLLLRLRPDSFGSIGRSGPNITLHFTGSDSYSYALQTSSNLLDWLTISTNVPSNGGFEVHEVLPPQEASRFYRTLLLP